MGEKIKPYFIVKEIIMKRVSTVVLAILCGLTTVRTQSYLETARRTIPTPPDVTGDPCNSGVARSLVFDFEPLREGSSALDLVLGKTVWEVEPFWEDPVMYRFRYSYNVNGEFPENLQFDYWSSPCWTPLYVNKLVFGRLRPYASPPRRDLALIQSGFPYRTRIYQNTMGTILPLSPSQDLNGNAVDGSWGAFTSNDQLDDLAVSDPGNVNGSQIRIYPNNGDGTLNETGVLVFYNLAGKIVLAQINKEIDYPVSVDKLDLVGVAGTEINIWANDNANGMYLLQNPIGLGIGASITSLMVSDINNDGYNDIVVGYNQGVQLFLNTGGPTPTIHSTPDWWYTIPPGQFRTHLIAVGDIGSRTEEGGGSRTDGWNDLVVINAGESAPYMAPTVRVFANQRGIGQYPLFKPSPQQQFTPSGGEKGGDEDPPCEEDVQEIGLADVHSTGGLSLFFVKKCEFGLYMLWHDGDPAPAPPKGVSAGYTPCPSIQHPVISWAQNSERDLSGYNIYKSSDGGQQWVRQNTSLITGNSWIDYTEGIDCEIHEGWPVWRYYYVTSVDNAVNESSPSAQVAALVDGEAPIEKRAVGAVEKPKSYALHTAFPNPFNPSTEIKFDLPNGGFVSLAVYDILGRAVAELVNDYREAGYHSATWNAANVSSGVYFARVTVRNELGRVQYTKMSKLVLMK